MKVLSVILTVALAFSCVTPIYATSTGSALTYDDQWIFEAAGIKPIEMASLEISDLKAASTPDGSQARPFYSIANTEGIWSAWHLDENNEESDITQVSILSFVQLFQEMYDGIVVSLENQMKYLFYHQVPLEGGGYSESGLLMMERNLLGSYVALLEMQPVLNTVSSRINTTNTNLNTINTAIGTTNSKLNSLWNWSNTFNSNSTLPRYRQNGEGGSGSDLSINPTVRSLPNQIWYWLSTMNTSMVYAFRDLTSGVSTANTQTYLDKDLQPVSMGRTSFWRDFRNIGGNINDLVARLAYVLASDDEIAARAQAANNQAAIVDDFVNPNGAGSISVSDIGDMADLSDSMKDTFSSNVDPSLIFDGVGSDSHAWDWFSNDVKNSLAYNPSRGSNQLRSAPATDSATPYLDAYYRDVQEALGINLW